MRQTDIGRTDLGQHRRVWREPGLLWLWTVSRQRSIPQPWHALAIGSTLLFPCFIRHAATRSDPAACSYPSPSKANRTYLLVPRSATTGCSTNRPLLVSRSTGPG